MSGLVRPFAALRPDPRRAAEVVAPPYDVVDTDEARALAAGKPLSFLHVSRPEIDLPPGADPASDAAYERAEQNFRALEERGVLVRDTTPGLYVYRMEMAGHAQTGVALTASVRAYNENRVRKHELTRPQKERDRVRHIEALDAQTGPVLCAYRAQARLRTLLAAGAAGAPLLEVTGPNDVRHTIWRVADAEPLAAITAALDGLDALYIADGHHRSAAAARVAASRRTPSTPRDASFEYFLVVAFPDDEMVIHDYNRVVTDLGGLDAAVLLRRLEAAFDIEPLDAAQKPVRPQTFAMYLERRWYRLELREPVPEHPVERLDVSLLQRHVLEPVLGVGETRTDPRVDFVGGIRGLGELEKRVDSGRAAVAFALYPTRMSELMAVADANELMPPKSTWFEPKLADGLLSHVLD